MGLILGVSRPYGVLGGQRTSISVSPPAGFVPGETSNRFDILTEIYEDGTVKGDPSLVQHLLEKREDLQAEFTHWEARVNSHLLKGKSLPDFQEAVRASSREASLGSSRQRIAAKLAKADLLLLLSQFNRLHAEGRLTESQRQQLLRAFVQALGSQGTITTKGM